jgi:transposase InsO family protein
MGDHPRREQPSLIPPTGLPNPDDAVIAGTRGFTPEALRPFLECSRLIALGLAHVLSGWWRRGEPVRAGFAERMVAHVELEKAREVNDILRSRLERFPARQRKHYTPEERLRIVVLLQTYGLGPADAARLFLVDAQTIARWQREALADPGTKAVGTLLTARPPLRSYDYVVRRLVRMLDAYRIGGSAKIAHMLARAGIRIGWETIRRYRRAPRLPHPEGGVAASRLLRAKYVNHVWMTDLTQIRGFLGLFVYKLLVVLDVFSRFPLAYGVFTKEPTAEEVLGVIDQAMRRHGRPRHLVTDKGSQFTAAVFRETLEALSIRQRFGAVGRYGSILIIERFWRTLKDLLGCRLWPPLSPAHLEVRTEFALAYYAHLRPHQDLGGATPAAVYYDDEPAVLRAVPPPRAKEHVSPGDEPPPFEVVFLDPERRMPVLVPASKAA